MSALGDSYRALTEVVTSCEWAAVLAALDLMAGNMSHPTFKAGYTRENAVIAACELVDGARFDVVEVMVNRIWTGRGVTT